MERQIKFTLVARDALHKLHIDAQRSLKSALKKLAKGDIQGKPLKEQLTGFYSITVGNYRAIYAIEKEIIIVFDAGHRKSIYDKKRSDNYSMS